MHIIWDSSFLQCYSKQLSKIFRNLKQCLKAKRGLKKQKNLHFKCVLLNDWIIHGLNSDPQKTFSEWKMLDWKNETNEPFKIAHSSIGH